MSRWKNYIKTEPEKQSVNWIKLTHNSDQCQEFVNTIVAAENHKIAGAKSDDRKVKQHKYRYLMRNLFGGGELYLSVLK
jgi:GTP-dependent phosphoenolpyruvate carboxykinase